MGATFDRELMEQVGLKLLAREAKLRAASVVLAPTCNIQRVSLFTQAVDPFFSQVNNHRIRLVEGWALWIVPVTMANSPNVHYRVLKVSQKIPTCLEFSLVHTSMVFNKGVSEQLSNTLCIVFVSINHCRPWRCQCSGNDKENDRLGYNSIIDERSLREIYLLPFMLAQKLSSPWSVMTWYVNSISELVYTESNDHLSYNRVNGIHVAENPEIIQKILREEWKSDAMVCSGSLPPLVFC